jgi:hypothetical protein
MRKAAAGVVGWFMLAAVAQAAQPQFWDTEGAADFLAGELQGLSVDANGRVRLAPVAPVLYNPSAPYVWTLARDAAGTVYAGTGNDGMVFRIAGGKSEQFFDAPELEVHAIAVGRDGRVYVASSPDGKIYVVNKDGSSKEFFDPEERYIWALAFDAKGNLLVATGGEGKVLRVSPAGKAETILQGSETHILCLAQDAAGRIYAGSSPGGTVYRIDAGDKVSVIEDTPYREVKAIALGKDGSVYVAALQRKDDATAVATPVTPAAVSAPAAAAAAAEATVTVTEAVVSVLAPTPPTASGARTAESPKTSQAKGAVLRLLPSGETETLWSSTEEMPHALIRSGDALLLGTGNKGKLYRISDDRTWTMVTTLPVEQVTALVEGTGGHVVVAGSNPGAIYTVGGAPRPEGTFLSKVKDMETTSALGRLHWHAETPAGAGIKVSTRSGNTGSPDNTWSDWSAPATHADGEPIASPSARFLQLKVVLTGKDGATPVLDTIGAAYLQRNLRPQVTSVTVLAPGEVFQKPLSVSGDTEILGYDPPPADTPERQAAARASLAMPVTTYSKKVLQRGLQTFTWKAEDPNGDLLTYDVDYRPAGDTRFRSLRKGLTDSILVWDTTTVPNGRYVIRVVARDSASNPGDQALSGEKESVTFVVDNTPPQVTASFVAPDRVHAVARDDISIIRKAEYSVDGGRWDEVHPIDGISDSLEEKYDFQLRGLEPGPHVVVVRATDLLGNASTARVDVP